MGGNHHKQKAEKESGSYNFYMYDKIHPTKAGYLKWWTPVIEAFLYKYLSE